jgi:signal peptide peptidase SppA
MSNFAQLAGRLFNAPLAIHPQRAEVIVASLAARLGIARIETTFASDMDMAAPVQSGNREVGYDVAAGIAVIPVQGTLVHKSGYLRPVCGMTGYDGIRQNLLMALADPDVRGVWLDIESPGGEVSGCFDLVDTIHAARGEKPIWAMVDESAYSAAYAIASAADRIIVPRTGGVGSVGVITMHMDWSDALDEAGLKVTIVTHGDHKADGNPYQRLPKDVQARIQADIDTMGALFIETVARNRNLAPSTVRDTQAGCFLGAQGVALGLADSVMAPDAAFNEFVKSLI